MDGGRGLLLVVMGFCLFALLSLWRVVFCGFVYMCGYRVFVCFSGGM